jgi:hypothetical protein
MRKADGTGKLNDVRLPGTLNPSLNGDTFFGQTIPGPVTRQLKTQNIYPTLNQVSAG